MSITSLTFIIFIAITLLLYYVVPKKAQWILLLVASAFFYLSYGFKSAIYVLFTATTIYFATLLMQKISLNKKEFLKENKEKLTKEEKSKAKNRIKRIRFSIMLITLLLNIGLLCFFKYFHFALEQYNAVAGWFNGCLITDTFKFLVPLGISFYTFQSIGYLVDVYWEYYEPEKNYFKVLLFVSFFPQMTQGPISDFKELTGELFTEHKFSAKNFTWGFQRMLWGFTKKMLIACILSTYVNDVFANYGNYTGIATLIGAFMYSVQIYADFSGYMDIMCGLCEMMGIKLTENFDRPYFSKSIAEYWRRWHISLGTWFKKYIYYPIGMSSGCRKIAKNTKDKLGKHFADSMPATIALLVTWLATGLWHGASWGYIAWGLVNGLFIILSVWLEPVYIATKQKLKINEEKWLWRAFQTLRTFILITFIKVLPEVGTLSDGFGLWKRIFTNHDIPHGISQLVPLLTPSLNFETISFLLAVLFTVLLFVSSLLQRKKPIREYFNALPLVLRVIIISVLIIIIISFGVRATWGAEGFLYANF